MQKKGFTLIELLVTIAIVALLVAILFPVLMRSREAARKATCQSNLHQIGVAFRLYQDDYDSFYPCNGDPNLWMGRNWRVLIQHYLPGRRVQSLPPGYPGSVSVMHSDVLWCPSDSQATRIWERTSYAYSAAFFHTPQQINALASSLTASTCVSAGAIVGALRALPTQAQPDSAVHYPAQKALIAEWLSNHEPFTGDCGFWDWRGSANFLFADGHVKYLRRRQITPAVNGLPDINLTWNGVEGMDLR
ncbi:MAG: hypothetical protein KatS3mg022_3151 [Armatimonadota bacterium]|nr:MAG: hypothetical protein KatS3mg022_3151 [Armatimonadota bacterium]